MIRFPKNIAHLSGETGDFRAGGTDIEARRQRSLILSTSGTQAPVLITDLRDMDDLNKIELLEDGSVQIGSMSTIEEIANHPQLQAYRGFVQAAGGLATPSVRRIARMGGNLLQQVRCPYPRQAGFSCLRTESQGCPARFGMQLSHALVDLGGCIAPHPSTLGMALLAWNAQILVASVGPDRPKRSNRNALRKVPISDLYRHSTTASAKPHTLTKNELLVGVVLPLVALTERSSWLRFSSRRFAEWPLVEAVVALNISQDQTISDVRIAVGGVAAVPLRLNSLEASIASNGIDAVERLIETEQLFTERFIQTAYKEDLLRVLLKDIFMDLITDRGL
ncbi:MAG: oxidoreductase [Proteobacteria bacterium]|nr:oxidoreductase [Pseudomonadota bacterium]